MLCAQTRTVPLLRQRAAGAYQLPRKLATDPPLSPAEVMVHDVTSDIGYPTGSSPCHRLYLRGRTQSKDLEATAQRNFTEQLIADLRLDFFFLSREESFAFLLQGKSKMSFGHSSENFKSNYILAITAT